MREHEEEHSFGDGARPPESGRSIIITPRETLARSTFSTPIHASVHVSTHAPPPSRSSTSQQELHLPAGRGGTRSHRVRHTQAPFPPLTYGEDSSNNTVTHSDPSQRSPDLQVPAGPQTCRSPWVCMM
ncbi:hypothetical protein EYF80_059666 [Liparis tanakae]|uniref:Uncharacterized protein n=1 Tax=Liparis tanakae TaxID=230148 RepID=A0A4Z2EP83_9TELE|nr:hypothetical protein EYF80_059666 [Liparis tanakae]